MPKNKIYLANLNMAVTETQLKDRFAEYGEITEIQLPLNKKTREAKGYAFITFTQETSAENALQQNSKPFLDKEITVQLATEKSRKKKLSP